jgi:hypothetical protein
VTRPVKSAPGVRSRRGPRGGRSRQLVDPAGLPGTKLHTLQNTLASLRLRLAVLVADPTCRWAQPDNIEALQRIAGEAMAQAQDLRATLDTSPRRRRKTGAPG